MYFRETVLLSKLFKLIEIMESTFPLYLPPDRVATKGQRLVGMVMIAWWVD